LALEQRFEGATVKFSYPAALENEVDAILPVLPLILIGRLGEAVKSWFLPTYGRGAKGYQFDKINDRVILINNSDMAELDRRWDQSTEGYVKPANYEEDSDASQEGFTNDFGGFEPSEIPERTTILNDGTDSLATMGIQDKLNDDNNSVWAEQTPVDTLASSTSETMASTLTAEEKTSKLELIRALLADGTLNEASKIALTNRAAPLNQNDASDQEVIVPMEE
jgi:hypothetical protein